MRLQRITMSRAMVPTLLRGHEMSEVKSNLPLDAELVDMGIDMNTMNIFFIMRSSEWPDLLEGAIIPDFDLRFTEYRSELDKLLKVLE